MSMPDYFKQFQLSPKSFDHSMTHRSFLNENPGTQSNERLEFLGDAILEHYVSDALYRTYPQHPEGVLTAMRSKLIQTKSLSSIAAKLELGKYLKLSKGEDQEGGRSNPSLLENSFEALVGAIYLDGGYPNVNKFLEAHMRQEIQNLSDVELKDPKSLYQEKVQALKQPTPTYKVVEETGPDHDKNFTVSVIVGNQTRGTGKGRSKQLAEQAAAKDALNKLEKSQ